MAVVLILFLLAASAAVDVAAAQLCLRMKLHQVDVCPLLYKPSNLYSRYQYASFELERLAWLQGLGRFVGVDEMHRLFEVGWAGEPSLRMLSWQAQWQLHLSHLRANLSKPAHAMHIFDNQACLDSILTCRLGARCRLHWKRSTSD